MNQGNSAITGEQYCGRLRNRDVDGCTDDRLGVLHGEAAHLVDLIENDVSVAGHEPECRQHLKLRSQGPKTRHAHVRDEDGIRDVFDGDERVLTESGCGIDDDVAEEFTKALDQSPSDADCTWSPSSGEGALATTKNPSA